MVLILHVLLFVCCFLRVVRCHFDKDFRAPSTNTFRIRKYDIFNCMHGIHHGQVGTE